MLGQFRETLTRYSESHSIKEQLLYKAHRPVLQALLTDAKKLHKVLLENQHRSKDEIKKLFELACNNCASRREDETLENIPKFNYRNFFLTPNEIDKVILESIEEVELSLDRTLEKIKSK